MELINDDMKYPQICIFPEGCTTNGKAVLRFKHGAFANLKPVQPYYIKYRSPFFNASFDMLSFISHVLMVACQPFIIVEYHKLPLIFPTEAMFKKYEHMGKDQGEIYANITQDIYSKTFGLKKSQFTLKDKNEFEKYIFDHGKLKLD